VSTRTVILFVCLPLLLVGFGQSALAQSQSLASTMDVYVFPKEGQDSAQQSKDESSCYDWAVSNVGTDPFELADKAEADEAQTQQQQAVAEQAGKGAGARGAVGGAAAGALIGEIASDDASEGAAWGAAAGLIHGRRKGRQAQEQAHVETDMAAAESNAATEEELTNFKKAFSVCLEAQDYMVKY